MRFSRFLQEPAPTPTSEGKLSVTRLVFFVWAIGVLFVWVRLSLKAEHLAAIPDSVMYILGILMTGKVVQRNFEGNPSNPNLGAPPPGPPPAPLGLAPAPPGPPPAPPPPPPPHPG